jgi:hypothetical protein
MSYGSFVGVCLLFSACSLSTVDYKPLRQLMPDPAAVELPPRIKDSLNVRFLFTITDG